VESGEPNSLQKLRKKRRENGGDDADRVARPSEVGEGVRP